MSSAEKNYVENDLVYRIAGCAMAVLNELGHGLLEKTYERALCVEFKHPKLEWKKIVLQE